MPLGWYSGCQHCAFATGTGGGCDGKLQSLRGGTTRGGGGTTIGSALAGGGTRTGGGCGGKLQSFSGGTTCGISHLMSAPHETIGTGGF